MVGINLQAISSKYTVFDVRLLKGVYLMLLPPFDGGGIEGGVAAQVKRMALD